MDLFNSIALPHSIEHFHLLLFIFNLLGLFFVPYFALLLGATLFSVTFDRRGAKGGEPDFLRLSDDLLACVIPNKSIFAFFAVLPSLAIIFVFAQLLQGTSAGAAGEMLLATLALITGGIALYVFRFTGTMQVFALNPGSRSIPHRAEEVDGGKVLHDLSATHRKAGTVAVAGFIVTAFLSAGAFSVAMNPDMWEGTPGILGLMLSGQVWVRTLQWAALGTAMSGGVLLFYIFSWNGGLSNLPGAYAELVKRVGTRMLTGSILVQPLILVADLLLQPAKTASGGKFLLAGCALVFLFVALHYVYAFARSPRSGYTAYGFFALLVAIGMLATMDQVTLHYASDTHASTLARTYEVETERLRASMGVSGPALTGEDIYNAKCSACHLFDAKKVGPPYNVVVQKYAGKRSSLISFILNPVKVDPAFPPMPGQGLKPAEADSIASFLLKKTGVRGS